MFEGRRDLTVIILVVDFMLLLGRGVNFDFWRPPNKLEKKRVYCSIASSRVGRCNFKEQERPISGKYLRRLTPFEVLIIRCLGI